MKNINIVPKNDDMFGLELLVKAWIKALHLLFLVKRKWTKQTNDPSNSIPYSEVKVTGLNKFQKINSDVLATIKREIPEPKPYPDLNKSSRRITINPAPINCPIIKHILKIPKVDGSP